MDNHFHLVLETPTANLARGMRQLNGRYAQRFNGRHKRIGHLFQGRYKALLIERGPYLLEACRYTVLNPARLRIPRRYDTWPWSSYQATAGLAPRPSWLALDRLLEQFDVVLALAQRRYRRFIHEGLERPSQLDPTDGEIYLASRAYVRHYGGKPNASPEILRGQREPIAVPLEQLLRSGTNHAVERAYRDGGYTLREIAAALGVHYSTISRRLAVEEREKVSSRRCAARPDPET